MCFRWLERLLWNATGKDIEGNIGKDLGGADEHRGNLPKDIDVAGILSGRGNPDDSGQSTNTERVQTVRKIDKIILHHSLTPDNVLLSDTEAIRRYHMSHAVDSHIVTKDEYDLMRLNAPTKHSFKAPWSEIGYHFLVERDDSDGTDGYDIKTGRNIEISGAHTSGQNEQSIGICVIGNFDAREPTDEEYTATAKLCYDLMRKYGIKHAEIYGHRDFASKSCPGKKFDLDEVRGRVIAMYDMDKES